MIDHPITKSTGAAVSALTICGLALNEWVYILTIALLVCQLGWFVWSKIIKKDKTE